MRLGTTFAFGYLITGIINALLDFLELLFRLLGKPIELLFKSLGMGWDASRRKGFDQAVAKIVTPHLPVLVKKRQELLRKDDYGVIKNEKWSKELGYFFANVLLPNLGSFSDYARRHMAYTAELVDDMIYSYQPQQQLPSDIAEHHRA